MPPSNEVPLEAQNDTTKLLPQDNDKPHVDLHGHVVRVGVAPIWSSVVNLCNTILGAGMLGLPYAFAECGMVFGLILLVLGALLGGLGLDLLASASRLLGLKSVSFFDLANAAVPRAAFLIDLAVAVKCWGVATAYLIVIGDLMPPAVGHIIELDGIFETRQFWITLIFCVVIFPLVCLQDLNALRFTSLAAIMTVVYLVVLVILYGAEAFQPCDDGVDDCVGDNPTFVALDTGFLKVLSIFIFGFTCHQNLFTLYTELKNNTRTRMGGVIWASVFNCFAIYTIVAVVGYETYGQKVASNLLNSYPEHDTVLTVGRIGITFLVAFSYPLQSHPFRISMLKLFWGGKPGTPRVESMRFWGITALCCVTTYAVAFFLDDLGTMMALVGATGSTLLSYILPGLFYTFICPTWTVRRCLAAFQLCLGIIIVPACCTFILLPE